MEILSEGSRGRDEVTKRHLYERHGVPEYWIVDPIIESVKIYRLDSSRRYQREAELFHEAGDDLESPLFTGLDLPLVALFE